MERRDVIFVLGNGRSGSSALTRIMSLCGCTLPQRVFGAEDGNPRGYWEPADAAALNLSFLMRHEANIPDPIMRLRGIIPCGEEESESFIGQIRKFLLSCPDGPRLLIKDPLINSLIQYWIDAVRLEGLREKVIILVRHPHEVLASGLAGLSRYGFPAASTDSIGLRWLLVNLHTERTTRGLPRIFVDHANLMANWRWEINRISELLSIDLVGNEGAVEDFLTRDLHRQKSAGEAPKVFGNSWLQDLYTIFSGAARGEVIDVEAIDKVHRELGLCRLVLEDLRKQRDYSALCKRFENRPVWVLGRDF